MTGVQGADAEGDRVVASASGVQVRKWVTEDAAAVPVVKYEVASARDERVAVALEDAVPEHLEPASVGFHDAFHGERWRRPAPRTLRFETTLAPEEELTTVYGVRQPAIEDEAPFLTEPELEVSAPVTVSESESEAVDARLEDALADAEAASDDEPPTGPEGGVDEAPETLDLDEPAAESADDGAGDAPVWGEEEPGAAFDDGDRGEPAPETSESADDVVGGAADSAAESDSSGEGASTSAAGAASGDDGTGDAAASTGEDAAGDAAADDDGAPSLAGGDGGVVERLTAELRGEDVDEETREALARELNLQLSASSSQFVEHLQSRTKERRDRLEGEVERLEDSIAELYGVKADSSEVSSVRESAADGERVAELAAAVDALEEATAEAEELAAVEDAVEALAEDAATAEELESTAASLRERVAELDETVAEVDDRTASEAGVEELAHGVSDLDDRTPSQEAFDSLRADHDELASSAATASDVEGVAEDLEALGERLEAEMEAVDADLRDRIGDEAAKREASLTDARERLDALEAQTADAERVATIEADLSERYVTGADVTDTIESRLRTSLLARTLLVAAGAFAGGGVALAATGVTAGAGLVVAAVAALGAWWYLQTRALDAAAD